MTVDELLSNTAHRPWELPGGKWQYYQEWNNVLFLHWEVPYEDLRMLVPSQLEIDSFEGRYYGSLVAFTMQKIRPHNLPAVKFISDFHEINIRTYIRNGGKQGVYFLNIEAGKRLSAFVARTLSGLPYEKSMIRRTQTEHRSFNAHKRLKINTSFHVKSVFESKTSLDKWLTERYCLYLEDAGSVFRYEIHHNEWEVRNVEFENLEIDYCIGKIQLSAGNLELAHYSKGVQVVSWKKEKI